MSDLASMLATILPSKAARVGAAIKNTVGYYLHVYYTYLREYKVRPLSLDEMVSGLLDIAVEREIKGIYNE